MPTKLRTTLSALFIFSVLLCASPADTVTLKDGTVIDGTITAETDDQVKISIRLTGGITDVKTIQRADIAEISKLTEEDLSRAKIVALIPTPSLLSAIDYETMIRSQVERFLNTYPASKYKKEIEGVLATLNEERAKASKGDIKIEDIWISAAEQKTDGANVDARILHYQMRQKAAAGDYPGALLDFDKLSADYIGTRSLVGAIDDALKILPEYGGIVAAQLRDLDARMKKRTEDLLLLPEHKRAENEAYFKKEIEGYKAAAERDKKLGLRWSTVNPNYKDGLLAVAKLIPAETKKIAAMDKAALTSVAGTLTKTQALVAERKLTQAQAGLDEAKKSVRGGLYLDSVQQNVEKLAATLAEEAEAAKKTESEKALETMNAYKAGGANAESTSTANPLDEVMKRKREAAEQAAKGNPGAGAKPAAKDKPAAAPVTSAAPAPSPSSGGGGISFQTIAVAVAIILMLVTGGALFIQKKKGG